MASLIVEGSSYFLSFSDGEGSGATSFFSYSPNLDVNFQTLFTIVNQLVNEVRGVQGPNQTLPADMLLLDDAAGVGVTPDTLIGTEQYAPSFVTTSRVDVSKGIAMLNSERVSSNVVTMLSPVAGTNDGGTDYAYIALDTNGAVTINTAPLSQALDLWRVEIVGGPLFADNIQRVGVWQYVMDGDAWVKMCDATGLGTTVTFPIEPAGVPTGLAFAEPSIRINRVERLLSGLVTDLQTPADTIGPIVIPGGSAATPGLIAGDGTGTAEVGTGFYRAGVDRLGVATAGVARAEFDAEGNLDLPTNMRVKGRRTDTQGIVTGGVLEDVDFTAADVFDVGTWHDSGGGSPEDFTVPTGGGGTYILTAAIEWAPAVTNRRDIRMELQVGGTLIPGGQASARLEIDEDHASTVTAVAVLSAANVVTVQVSQDDVDGGLGLDVIDATLSIVKVA